MPQVHLFGDCGVLAFILANLAAVHCLTKHAPLLLDQNVDEGRAEIVSRIMRFTEVRSANMHRLCGSEHQSQLFLEDWP